MLRLEAYEVTQYRCGFVMIIWHLYSWDDVISLVYIGLKQLILRMLDMKEKKIAKVKKRNAYDTCWKI